MRSNFESFDDIYSRQLKRQNSGLKCEHCNSSTGHFRNCPLINREAAEVKSAIGGELPLPDVQWLKAQHITW